MSLDECSDTQQKLSAVADKAANAKMGYSHKLQNVSEILLMVVDFFSFA